jgi:hypothetical protein
VRDDVTALAVLDLDGAVHEVQEKRDTCKVAAARAGNMRHLEIFYISSNTIILHKRKGCTLEQDGVLVDLQ